MGMSAREGLLVDRSGLRSPRIRGEGEIIAVVSFDREGDAERTGA
jgi:hypothetical protein